MRTKMPLRSGLAGLAITAVLALGSGVAFAESAADIAVREAKQYAGTTLTVIWEAGLQSLGPKNFSGPQWEELTGIKIEVVETQVNEMFPKMLQERAPRRAPTTS
jgi:multiple sugar transport system substrate-binding protein